MVSIYAGLPTVKNLIHPPSCRTARSHICQQCNNDTPKFDLGPGILQDVDTFEGHLRTHLLRRKVAKFPFTAFHQTLARHSAEQGGVG